MTMVFRSPRGWSARITRTTSRSSLARTRGLHHFAFWGRRLDGYPRHRRCPGVSRCSHRNESNATRCDARATASTSSIPQAIATRPSRGATKWIPEEPPITWTEAEMGRAIFYYDGVVDQHFLTVHS